MARNVEFYFDFGSPNAYLSHLVIPEIEQRTSEKFTYVPILLGGIFKETNNVSPAVSLQGIKNKPEYQALETRRFLAAHAISRYERNPYFPVNTLQLMRGAIYAQQTDYFEKYVDQMYRHMWAEPKKMDDADVFKAAMEESELPVSDILTGIQNPEIKAQLINNTSVAVARGVFGSPSFFVGDDLYFGKDRLRDVEQAIRG
jgi:2-hydroxychromene-2-carboxylate isomerase